MTVKPTETPPNPPPASQRWPGWPGDNVFRVIVPVVKVGSIIGKGGELIKKLCDETGARVRILDGPLGTPDRVVLISGKEEPEREVSPAMEAVLRVFKRTNAISSDGKTTIDSGVCSIRLLMASTQAMHLIGKQGSSIKSIQEESGALIHVLTGDERAYYASADERIVDVQGEPLKVLKALEAVVQHLRKFLVDHSMIALFEKTVNKQAAQVHVPDAWSDQNQSMLHSPQQTGIGNDYYLSLKRDSLFLDRERHDSQVLHSERSPYRQNPAPSALRSSGHGRLASALITKVTQTMQIPLRYAEDIIGSGGGNIEFIRARSGANILILEEGDRFDEIVVEIRGTPTQVQTAQQLIEDSIAGHKEPATGGYGSLDRRSGPALSQLTNTPYPSSSLSTQAYGGYRSSARSEPAFSQSVDTAYPSSSAPMQTYGGYGSSGLGGYDSYRY